MEPGQNEIRQEEGYLKRMPLKIFIFVFTSVVIYFGIASVLMIVGKHKNPYQAQRGPTFNELRFDYSSLPTLQRFSARDGEALSYRHYPAPSNPHPVAWLRLA